MKLVDERVRTAMMGSSERMKGISREEQKAETTTTGRTLSPLRRVEGVMRGSDDLKDGTLEVHSRKSTGSEDVVLVLVSSREEDRGHV